MRPRAAWFAIVAILVLGASPAFAQIGQGRLAGTVDRRAGRGAARRNGDSDVTGADRRRARR